MKRKEFLRGLGISAGAIMATYCFGGLSSCGDPGVDPAGDVDFTIDLTNSSYAALSSIGGWVKTNGVVVARTKDDNFVAVTQVCSHEQKTQVVYRSNSDDFYCGAHGATFSKSGSSTNRVASRGIASYQVDVTGDILHIHS